MAHKIEHEKELFSASNFAVRHVLLTEASKMYTYPTTKEDIVIYYFLSGSGVMDCSINTFDLKSEKIILVNSNEVYSIVTSNNLEFYYIVIRKSFFKEANYQNVVFYNDLSEDTTLKSYLADACFQIKDKSIGYEFALTGDIYHIVLQLIRNYQVLYSNMPEFSRKDSALKSKNIVDYIYENYMENITSADIAKVFFLNHSYLCRIFKSETGMSITDYINHVRILKATSYLLTTNMSVTDVAGVVGYIDTNYFSRIFKKYTGKSPSKFRNSSKNSTQNN